ncbi:benzoate 4-monooxygenase cytochrome P450 [Pseudomassariella vexata]|uniref:Benzoate 4-monooxygenase cytochrome P450 n=1 Tax=Pseudomassariella vexata TaxID=1141098 RepID=A0A1Y2E9L6_9PEZI|nr:benzoate 4-monooxygenase cytochrome P450 [Pseudomassariella vexata]ORY68270.1 benzoate 4-monooxygenase cytochrome P450 [Pseudomassariella vexata]
MVAYGWERGRTSSHIHTKRLHDALQKHPVIRIGPNWLSFGRSQAAKDIYGYASKCVKGGAYDLLAAGGRNLNNISDKPFHSGRRRMVAAFYAPKNQEEWEFKVADSVRTLMEQMDRRCTEPHDLQVVRQEELAFDGVYWIFLYAAEAVTKITMSKDLGFLRNGNDSIRFKDDEGKNYCVPMIQDNHAVGRAAAPLLFDVENFALWQKLANLFSKKFAENWQKGVNFHLAIEALTKERMERSANGEILNDLCQPMIEDRKGDGADITMKDRVAEIEQALGAGTDGPAVSISMALYYLVRYPHTFAKLRAELDEVLSLDDIVTPWSKIKNLPYLRACIDEGMRLAPPVATDLMRRTPPEVTTIIDGNLIPPNTNVSISAYTAHRDPTVFEDPEAYNPDRWLAKGSERLKEMLAVYIPFSAGTRGCIGKNVTIVIQAVCLATLVYRYEFSLPHQGWEMEYEEWFNLWPLSLPLKVWRRGPASFTKAQSS